MKLLPLIWLLAQNPATLAGINYTPVAAGPDYFASLFIGGLPTRCDGAAVTLDQGGSVTFARASTAYCVNDSNGLTAVTSNQPRVQPNGLLIEGSRTNLTLQSQTMDDAAWTKENVTISANTADTTAPDGTNTAEKVTISATTNQHRLFPAASQSVTGAYSLSVYIKPGTLSHVGLIPSSAINARVSVKLSDCTTSSTAGAAYITSRVVAIANGWCYVSLVYTGDGTGSRVILKFGNSDANTVSGTTWLGTGETVYVWQGQHEAGGWSSSPITTTTTTVNRPAEVASFTPASSIAAAGCIYAEFYGPTVINNGGRIWGLPAASGSGFLQMGAANTTITLGDGTNTVSTSAATSFLNRLAETRSWWNSSTQMSVDVDAVTGAPGTFDAAVSTGALELGSQDGAAHGDVQIKKLTVGTSAGGCMQ